MKLVHPGVCVYGEIARDFPVSYLAHVRIASKKTFPYVTYNSLQPSMDGNSVLQPRAGLTDICTQTQYACREGQTPGDSSLPPSSQG